ncbi:hypothetical protein GWK08_06005 [Leptobacterium flavescens]|uniref:Lipoprotein n=1 Tax=Leptobacterium flavescens TaxID=472055 RepID=A0A6P0UIA6_9FLAO|nr:hypothetical protein [Leptobacterium flavescens]NER12984.1 hypothetical protein [Leptobacterium flavescens]
MRKYKQHIILILGLISFISCTQKSFDTEEALWAHLKEEPNGYVQHKTINGIDFTLTYRPTDLLVKQELGKDINEKRVDSLREKYGEYLYFNLSMSRNNQELLSSTAHDRNRFGLLVNQLAFGMTNKVHLYTPKRDTIALLDYIYPRMYGMSNRTSMLLVYPKEEQLMKQDHINLSIEDIGLFTGEVTFKIPLDPLKDEPKLNFNKMLP